MLFQNSMILCSAIFLLLHNFAESNMMPFQSLLKPHDPSLTLIKQGKVIEKEGFLVFVCSKDILFIHNNEAVKDDVYYEWLHFLYPRRRTADDSGFFHKLRMTWVH